MKSMTNKIEQQKNYEYRDSFRWVLTGTGRHVDPLRDFNRQCGL